MTTSTLTIDSSSSAEKLIGLPVPMAEKILADNKYSRGNTKKDKQAKTATIQFVKRGRYGRTIVEITHEWVDSSFGVSRPGPIKTVSFYMDTYGQA